MDVLTLDSHAKDLLIYLNELYQGKSLCDMHIRSKDGIYFTAHKIVLASSSLHVYQMVMANPGLSQISLDVPSHVLQSLIEFIYTGKLLVPRHLWLEVQNAATFLQMYNVLDLMKGFVMGEVQPGHIEPTHLDLSTTNLDLTRTNTNLDPTRTNTNLDPTHTNTNLDPTRTNANLDLTRTNTPLGPLRASTNLYPMHSSMNVDPTCTHANLDPSHLNSNVNPTTSLDLTCTNTVLDQTATSTKADQAQQIQTGPNTTPPNNLHKQAKSVTDASTMTITDWIEDSKTSDNNYTLIKTEKADSLPVKTEILTCDPDSGPLPRLRPQVRQNFSKAFEVKTYSQSQRKPKRKSTPGKSKTQPPKSKPKRKRRKHKKRLNRFGKEMRYKCLYCNQKFKLLYKRHRHMCHSHSQKYFTWLYSSFALHKQLRLKLASNFCVRQIGSRKLHKCKLCNKRFSKYSFYIYHYGRKHVSTWKQTWFNYVSHRSQRLPKRSKCKREFECLQCPKAFISESNLAIHYERYHYDPNDPYQLGLIKRLKERRADISCKLCGKSYHFQSSLSRHMILHNDDKPHQCATCGKIFSLKAGLKEHAIVHGENKTCICAVCGKCYKHRQSLRRHMTEHDPDKKVYNCSFCGKVYDRNDKLLTHMRTHESLHDLLAPPPPTLPPPPSHSLPPPPTSHLPPSHQPPPHPHINYF